MYTAFCAVRDWIVLSLRPECLFDNVLLPPRTSTGDKDGKRKQARAIFHIRVMERDGTRYFR